MLMRHNSQNVLNLSFRSLIRSDIKRFISRIDDWFSRQQYIHIVESEVLW